jgi:hypothetical protein
MNRLVLTDEEDAEYRLFEAVISSNETFKSSRVMLCIFHAIWQPFKRDVYLLLPKEHSDGKGGKLTKRGKQFGKNYCITLLKIVVIYNTQTKLT